MLRLDQEGLEDRNCSVKNSEGHVCEVFVLFFWLFSVFRLDQEGLEDRGFEGAEQRGTGAGETHTHFCDLLQNRTDLFASRGAIAGLLGGMFARPWSILIPIFDGTVHQLCV